jgi:hypothetical protein
MLHDKGTVAAKDNYAFAICTTADLEVRLCRRRAPSVRDALEACTQGYPEWTTTRVAARGLAIINQNIV